MLGFVTRTRYSKMFFVIPKLQSASRLVCSVTSQHVLMRCTAAVGSVPLQMAHSTTRYRRNRQHLFADEPLPPCSRLFFFCLDNSQIRHIRRLTIYVVNKGCLPLRHFIFILHFEYLDSFLGAHSSF